MVTADILKMDKRMEDGIKKSANSLPIASTQGWPVRQIPVLGTPLAVTSYSDLSQVLFDRAIQPGPVSVDFSNTHIVTMRCHDPGFAAMTSSVDLFVPDGMPLIWTLNSRGAKLKDRVYGPTFLRECVKLSPPSTRHYFLGGNETCLDLLISNLRTSNPSLQIAGSRNGYFQLNEEDAIVQDIVASDADLVWIGLGTPKQQAFIQKWKSSFPRGVLLAVGFAFDVNAGTKPDAPLWMQRLGLTWVYRLASEPRRLFARYAKWNSLFLLYLALESLGCGKRPVG